MNQDATRMSPTKVIVTRAARSVRESRRMTNRKFMEQVLAGMVRKNEWPVGLLTQRQASKFRNKRGTLYNDYFKFQKGV